MDNISIEDTRQYRVMYESAEGMDDRKGEIIKSSKQTYQLGAKLGSGAFSSVYSAQDVDSGAVYAAK